MFNAEVLCVPCFISENAQWMSIKFGNSYVHSNVFRKLDSSPCV
jgi:hypothetical protein